MREIKFRAWTGREMEYRVVVGALGAFYVEGIDPKDSACLSQFNTKYSDQTPIMQFTGLKDKNGKGIYEGDILQWRCATTQTGNRVKLRTVTIQWGDWPTSHGYNLTIYINDEKYAPGKSYWNNEDREVIGNIYENKELLNAIQNI